MKKTYIISALAALCFLASSCHEPEYVEMTAEMQGITSLTAIMTVGDYVDQELASLKMNDPDATEYVIPIPWYFPETSDNQTLTYMTRLRVKAELQPNWKLSPSLGILDLTEENEFTLTDPFGKSRKIIITGDRRHSSNADLVTLMIEDVMVSGIINKTAKTVLIPCFEDLSNVKVSGQVSPHATLSKIGGKKYVSTGRFNLNDGSTVTVTADDGTEITYAVSQGNPELIDMGLNKNSIEPLFNIDPVSMLGLPAYNELAYVSLAGQGNNIIVCTGSDRAPILVNRYNGAKAGTVNTGSAVVDVVTVDEAEHVLMANAANKGEDVNIYRSDDVKVAPTLFHTFKDTLDVPLGHRMKVIGDINSDAAIVFTTEGIVGVTTSARAVLLKVRGGAVEGEPVVIDFAAQGFGWGAAPVGFATVVGASTDPQKDGWFLDWYEGNADPSVTDDQAPCYMLHYINAKGQNSTIDLVGNWADNPNCLDSKRFNNSTYMALFTVSHFPQWGIGPELHLYDITDPASASKVLAAQNIKWSQEGTYDGEVGAAGDVVICPSSDGFRVFVYYYDHHAQAIGAYVADCIKQ